MLDPSVDRLHMTYRFLLGKLNLEQLEAIHKLTPKQLKTIHKLDGDALDIVAELVEAKG